MWRVETVYEGVDPASVHEDHPQEGQESVRGYWPAAGGHEIVWRPRGQNNQDANVSTVFKNRMQFCQAYDEPLARKRARVVEEAMDVDGLGVSTSGIEDGFVLSIPADQHVVSILVRAWRFLVSDPQARAELERLGIDLPIEVPVESILPFWKRLCKGLGEDSANQGRIYVVGAMILASDPDEEQIRRLASVVFNDSNAVQLCGEVGVMIPRNVTSVAEAAQKLGEIWLKYSEVEERGDGDGAISEQERAFMGYCEHLVDSPVCNWLQNVIHAFEMSVGGEGASP